MTEYCCWGCEAGYACEAPDSVELEPAFFSVFRGRFVDPRHPDPEAV